MREDETHAAVAELRVEKTGKEDLEASGLQDAAEKPAEVEAPSKRRFPVIGIGASAGGLEAIEEFFQNVPRDSGMAYVVISHTDPARSSLLPEIIRRRSNIPVVEVMDGMGIEPEYHIPAPIQQGPGARGELIPP